MMRSLFATLVLFLLLLSPAARAQSSGSCTLNLAAPSNNCVLLQGGNTYTVTIPAPSLSVTLAPAGDALRNSIDLVRASSDFLNRLFGAPTSAMTWTWNGWVKRTSFPTDGEFVLGVGGSTYEQLGFSGSVVSGSPPHRFILRDGSGAAIDVETAATITDSLWHMLTVAVDTTQPTPANRVHIYIDGVEGAYAVANYPALNAATQINSSGAQHYLGTYGNVNYFFDGKLAGVTFVDGQQLAPSAFATISGGTIAPAQYTGALGNNGFALSFCDVGHIGYDDGSGPQCGFSGVNTWTVSGATLDPDVP